MKTISIVCPTVPDREYWLERVWRTYCELTDDAEFIIVHGYPTCNSAWNAGIEQTTGRYIFLGADDLEPHPGWVGEAIWWVEQGVLPCPRILNTDGTLQSCGDTANERPTGTPSDVCRAPFLKREWLDWAYPIPGEMHYMGDYWITDQGRKNGVPTQVVREFCLTHHMAQEGRLDRLAEDVRLYRKLR